MRSNKLLLTIVYLLILVVFNLVFFIAVDSNDRTTQAWISYAFVHIAWFVMLIEPTLVPNRSNPDDKMRGDYQRPLGGLVVGYFFVALFVACLVLFKAMEPSVAAVWVIHIVLLFIVIAIMLFTMMANNHTQQQVKRHAVELQYVRQGSETLRALVDRYADQRLTPLYDLLRTSPLRSSANAQPVEQQVLNMIDLLGQAYASGDTDRQQKLIDEIALRANQRNRLLNS